MDNISRNLRRIEPDATLKAQVFSRIQKQRRYETRMRVSLFGTGAVSAFSFTLYLANLLYQSFAQSGLY